MKFEDIINVLFIEIIDDWDNWKGEQDDYDNAPHCEDDDFNVNLYFVVD